MLNPHLGLSLQPLSSGSAMSLSLWRSLMFGEDSALRTFMSTWLQLTWMFNPVLHLTVVLFG